MRKLVLQALVFVCFSAAVAVVSSAQAVNLRVDIPFNFNVGEKVLPAGHYLILAPQDQPLEIVGPKGPAALALAYSVSGPRPDRADRPGVVAFNCYGRRCFLSQFWLEGWGTGQELLKCRLEKELAREKEQLAVITLKTEPNQ